MGGAERTRGCLARTARSALRAYVRCRADTSHVCVSSAWREALSARMCGAEQTRACLACIARSALRKYVRCRADTWVSRLHSAKRSSHICVVQGGHVRVSPAWRRSLAARMCGAGRTRGCIACIMIARSALHLYVRCRADTCVSRLHSERVSRTYVRCRADTCVSRLRDAKRSPHILVFAVRGGHICVSPA
jgi:hypothetical protein